MSRHIFHIIFIAIASSNALNLDYLDPTKLQTKTTAQNQQQTASNIIAKYTNQVIVQIDPSLFQDNKDVFHLRTVENQLVIRASTGVAAVWGFNYYLKKYCKSQIAWQIQRVSIPSTLPEVDETVVASDRFRYYQNVCTSSYSFIWWDETDWKDHVEWMALNGINLVLAPIAQEAAWARVYKKLGMTQDEINQHFTGPAFLSWLRMGNVRGWGGPLPQSWHEIQTKIQHVIVNYMYQLGIVPVFPSFSGHVPRAFARIYPNTTFHSVGSWNRFKDNYCCDLYVDPSDPAFADIGRMFLREITVVTPASSVYSADPFNEIKMTVWTTDFVQRSARAVFSAMGTDENAVWLVQNWMFVHDPILWPKERVQAFLKSVPSGRMLVLDLQSEQWPQYYLYEMYFDQPFIWCMLHNFGGTLGMFGSMDVINNNVYEVRSRINSTMIGIGLTPEGINQNYVVYDLMLESGWRKEPVADLKQWVAEYAERRYGCNATSSAWRSLLRSVYNFDGLNMMRGKYVITRRPSLKIKPWAWYKSSDLFDAFQKFVFVTDSDCFTPGFYHDLVDLTRQALQYRAEQLYINLVNNWRSNTWIFKSSVSQYLDAMNDIESILSTNSDFSMYNWLNKARSFGTTQAETYQYELNARNQITWWGPNGEISDYACKQWTEVFHFYYTPRWKAFLDAAADAKTRNEKFDERNAQRMVKMTVERLFLYGPIDIEIRVPRITDPRDTALGLYEKWAFVPDLEDLPLNIIKREINPRTTLVDVANTPSGYVSVVMMQSTTPEFIMGY